MGTTAEEGGPGRASARASGGEWARQAGGAARRAIWGNLESLSEEINPPHPGRAAPDHAVLEFPLS